MMDVYPDVGRVGPSLTRWLMTRVLARPLVDLRLFHERHGLFGHRRW